jgi:Protein of unknown function (DUF4058)
MKPNFPGMNPYLEDPEIWVELHSWLIVQLARSLNPQLTPKYRAAVEKRVYSDTVLVGIPDVSVFSKSKTQTDFATATLTASTPQRVSVPMIEEVQESYLEIREVATGQVVTVIELLSTKNKRSGEGQNQYNAKRNRVLNSATNLVEIDLLRTGIAPIIVETITCQYRILVSRSSMRPGADLYGFNLRDPIPVFPLPLLMGDSPPGTLREQEPLINLKTLMDQIYEEAALDLAINYAAPPKVKLQDEDWEWVRSITTT